MTDESAITRGWKWCRRNPITAALISGVMLTAFIAPVIALAMHRLLRQERVALPLLRQEQTAIEQATSEAEASRHRALEFQRQTAPQSLLALQGSAETILAKLHDHWDSQTIDRQCQALILRGKAMRLHADATELIQKLPESTLRDESNAFWEKFRVELRNDEAKWLTECSLQPLEIPGLTDSGTPDVHSAIQPQFLENTVAWFRRDSGRSAPTHDLILERFNTATMRRERSLPLFKVQSGTESPQIHLSGQFVVAVRSKGADRPAGQPQEIVVEKINTVDGTRDIYSLPQEMGSELRHILISDDGEYIAARSQSRPVSASPVWSISRKQIVGQVPSDALMMRFDSASRVVVLREASDRSELQTYNVLKNAYIDEPVSAPLYKDSVGPMGTFLVDPSGCFLLHSTRDRESDAWIHDLRSGAKCELASMQSPQDDVRTVWAMDPLHVARLDATSLTLFRTEKGARLTSMRLGDSDPSLRTDRQLYMGSSPFLIIAKLGRAWRAWSFTNAERARSEYILPTATEQEGTRREPSAKSRSSETDAPIAICAAADPTMPPVFHLASETSLWSWPLTPIPLSPGLVYWQDWPNMIDGRLNLAAEDCDIVSIAVASRGQAIAAVTTAGHVAVWDLASADCRWETQLNLKNAQAVRFSPDENQLICAGSDLLIVDSQTGRERLRLGTAGADLTNVRFTPDGHTLAAAARRSGQSVLFKWDLESMRRVLNARQLDW